jgi:hypothetical protein
VRLTIHGDKIVGVSENRTLTNDDSGAGEREEAVVPLFAPDPKRDLGIRTSSPASAPGRPGWPAAKSSSELAREKEEVPIYGAPSDHPAQFGEISLAEILRDNLRRQAAPPILPRENEA